MMALGLGLNLGTQAQAYGEKGCLSFAHHGFGLGFEFGAHPICIEG